MIVRVNKTEYLDEQGLNALWEKIKEYISLHGGTEIDLSDYTTKEELATELSKYYDKTEIDALLSDIDVDIDLTNYYTKTEVDQKIESIPETDLSNYYTKTETYNKTEIDTKLEEVVAGELDLSTYAKIDYVDKGDNLEILEYFDDYTLDGTQVDAMNVSILNDIEEFSIADDNGNTPRIIMVSKDDNTDSVINDYITSENGTVNNFNGEISDLILYGTIEGVGSTEDDITDLDPIQLEDYEFPFSSKITDQYGTYENTTPITTYAGGTKIKINSSNFTRLYATDKKIDDNNTLIEAYKMIFSFETDTLILPDTQDGTLVDYIIFQPCGELSGTVVDKSASTDDIILSKTYIENCWVDKDVIDGTYEWDQSDRVAPYHCYLYKIDASKVNYGIYINGQCYALARTPFIDGQTFWDNPTEYIQSYESYRFISREDLETKPYIYIWYGQFATNVDDYRNAEVYKSKDGYKTKFTMDVYNMDETLHSQYTINYGSSIKSKPMASEYIRYCSDDVKIKKSSSEYPFNININYKVVGIDEPEIMSIYLKERLYKDNYYRLSTNALIERKYKQTTKNYVYVDNLLNSDGTKYEPSTGDGEDGFSPIATVTQTETGATISITDKTGTTTATITNGTNGQDGADGEDGFSPTIVENANNNDTTYKLDITTKDSTFTTPNLKGADGTGGGGSGSGFNPFDYSNTNEVAVGTWVDGKTIYRQYYTWLMETNQTTNVTWIPHNIENIGATIKMEGFIQYGATCIQVNSMSVDPIYTGSSLSVSKFNEWLQGCLRLSTNGTSIALPPTNRGGYTMHLFLYYTKNS